METVDAFGYQFTEPSQPLTRIQFQIDPGTLEPGQCLVKVAGCGLCHTDLSFFSGQVKTRKLPLILGHEISGTVVAVGSESQTLLGKNLVIPAVLPCGDCGLCRKSRDNICQNQLMPGNDFDGGFASHVVVPSRFCTPLPDQLGGLSLADLSVVADAITTPYQSLLRSGTEKGDLAIVIGVGGIGNYMVQHAKNAGAVVIAVDVDDLKLQAAKSQGARYTLNSKGLDERELKKQVRSLVKEYGLPSDSWRVFETSGTAMGQASAFALLSFAGSVGIVGFTMDKLQLRLSNIMAFDADIFGNWGCRPELYPEVVKAVIDGKIQIRENIEQRPLSSINEVLPLALDHQLAKRIIFTP
jgi:6-hydroxycyclohex-1-ene-1-carbonyl-CoA dehydrogenase